MTAREGRRIVSVHVYVHPDCDRPPVGSDSVQVLRLDEDADWCLWCCLRRKRSKRSGDSQYDNKCRTDKTVKPFPTANHCSPPSARSRWSCLSGRHTPTVVLSVSIACVCPRAVTTAVAVFDFPHRQTGVAPNAIELHPILGFRCLG